MNKRNFGRVIKRIEKNLKNWDQDMVPAGSVERKKNGGHCGTPYCFLGHAEMIRAKKPLSKIGYEIETSPDLAKWLGLTANELYYVFHPENTLEDFRRWHKAGKVS